MSTRDHRRSGIKRTPPGTVLQPFQTTTELHNDTLLLAVELVLVTLSPADALKVCYWHMMTDNDLPRQVTVQFENSVVSD